MSTIRYRVNDELWDSEAIENGEPASIIDQGEQECDFRKMVNLLKGASPSSSTLGKGTWYSDYEFNNGTREYFEKGIERTRNYHPYTERDEKWMRVAWKMSHKDYAKRNKPCLVPDSEELF